MIWSFTSLTLCTMVMASFELEYFEFYNFTISRGIVEFLQMPSLTFYLQVSSFLLMQTYIIATYFRFLFRFAQGTMNRRLTQFLSTRNGIYIIFLICQITYIPTVLDVIRSVGDGKDFQEQFPSKNLAVKEYLQSHSVTAIQSGSFVRNFELVANPLCIIFGCICTYKSYVFQRNPYPKISERTRQTYHRQTMGLLSEEFFELVYFFAPYVCIPVYLPIEKHLIGYYIIYRMFYAFPAIVMVFNLTFYKEYLEGVRETLGIVKNKVQIPSLA
ncbi:unnamed protein product [Bursaphelenchus xylophilus]|uniref:(pine wood nematode) hypothetical protein n=1 Tax=Bursaphelenchus xylophilus TaxID=6326 RepID=A0A1I7S1K3_BURXY|nr:unnamed protein product [Bursaphelenchus xylophilus]CAG9081355.1 unnamed protein product [Bursaphelenchus xylophilus]